MNPEKMPEAGFSSYTSRAIERRVGGCCRLRALVSQLIRIDSFRGLAALHLPCGTLVCGRRVSCPTVAAES